jgi:hypothetical protein
MSRQTEGAAASRRTGPVRLDERYLRAVEKLESLPQNRSGADKSWVERALRDWRTHYARTLRVRR